MLALIRTQNAANNTFNRITQNNRKQRYFQHVESNNRIIDIFIRFDSWPERYPKKRHAVTCFKQSNWDSHIVRMHPVPLTHTLTCYLCELPGPNACAQVRCLWKKIFLLLKYRQFNTKVIGPNTSVHKQCLLYFSWKIYLKLKLSICSNMAVQTVLLDFSIEPSRLSDSGSRKDLVKQLQQTLVKYFPEMILIFEVSVNDGYLSIYSEKSTVLLNVRLFNQGIITINIEYYKGDCDHQRLSFDVSSTDASQFSLQYNWYVLSEIMFNRISCGKSFKAIYDPNRCSIVQEHALNGEWRILYVYVWYSHIYYKIVLCTM